VTRPRALVVFVHYPERLSYFADWLDAFRAAPDIDVVTANLVSPVGRRRLRRHVGDVDLVVTLHSVIGDSLDEVGRHGSPLLDRKAPLVSFVGNEVSLPTQPIAAKLELLARLDPQFIGTQLPLDAGTYLYDGLDAIVVPMPHALNPDVFRPDVANERRPIDVGFRGARYPRHVGDDDRNRILDYFSAQVDPSLVVDIDTKAGYARRGWARFLNRCKGTIGAESGSISLHRDDAILQHDELQDSRHARGRISPLNVPKTGSASSPLRRVHRYLPRSVKRALRPAVDRLSRRTPEPATTLDQPWRMTTSSGSVSGKGVSSRHFDAIGTETCQILLPGRYNDLLEPDRHYLCLAPDFSNIDDVLGRFRDDTHRLRLVRETREWALADHTYAHRVRSLIAAVGA